MDHIVKWLVYLFVFFSRFVPFLTKFGFRNYRSYADYKKDGTLHVLLAGYNGAKNTGSDVRVAEIARQLEERLGKDHVEISVMTMDGKAMQGYFGPEVHLIHCNAIFFVDVFRACLANQAVILCEGSTLKSKFANALTLYSCEAAGIMKNQHKPCIAYGSEAGEMDAFLERAVKRLCSDTYFIARNQNSLDKICELGFKGHLGTDTAFCFDSASYTVWAQKELETAGVGKDSFLLGIAPVNPFWWPVKPSLFRWCLTKITKDRSLQFRLWYFFSWSKKRKQQFETYLDAIAQAVKSFAAEHPCHVMIFGMEDLDADACKKLAAKLSMPVSVFLSSENDGYRMAAMLRQLSALITSRYHAQVLSMEAGVPSVAISMDERLDNIMNDLGFERQLLSADDPDLSAGITKALSYVQEKKEQIQEKTAEQLAVYQDTFEKMGDFLTSWLLSYDKKTV